MKLTTAQRKQVKNFNQLKLDNGVRLTYGVTNGDAAPELCDYKYDGFECSRFAIWVNEELKVISNTWTKVERYLTEECEL
mgnify:CR=1 FL=1